MLPWKVLQAYEKCIFSPQDLDTKCNTTKRKLIEPTWEINSKKWQILRGTKCRFFHHSKMHNKMKYHIMHSCAKALMENHQGDSFSTAYCGKMTFKSTKYDILRGTKSVFSIIAKCTIKWNIISFRTKAMHCYWNRCFITKMKIVEIAEIQTMKISE